MDSVAQAIRRAASHLKVRRYNVEAESTRPGCLANHGKGPDPAIGVVRLLTTMTMCIRRSFLHHKLGLGCFLKSKNITRVFRDSSIHRQISRPLCRRNRGLTHRMRWEAGLCAALRANFPLRNRNEMPLFCTYVRNVELRASCRCHPRCSSHKAHLSFRLRGRCHSWHSARGPNSGHREYETIKAFALLFESCTFQTIGIQRII